MSDTNTVTVPCRNCASAEHQVRGDFKTLAVPIEEPGPGQGELFATISAQMLQCCSCDSISFRLGWSEGSREIVHWTMYPNPRALRPRIDAPLPERVGKLYRETLEAINASCLTLAAAGMRATVEAICLEYGCKGSDLQEKIGKLKVNNLLSGREANALQAHRIFGNDALHKMRAPSLEQAMEALALLEHVLETLYALPQRTNKLLRMRAACLQLSDQSRIRAS